MVAGRGRFSRNEIWQYTDGLKFFRYLEYIGGHADLADELSFEVVFRSHEAMEEAKALQLSSFLLSPDLVEKYPRACLDVYASRAIPGGLYVQLRKFGDEMKMEDFQLARIIEEKIASLSIFQDAKFHPPVTYATRGYHRGEEP